MVTPYLNHSLTDLRYEINAAYPHRDKESDGWVGDTAHQQRQSDHNPDPPGSRTPGSVDAIDVDVNLNGKGKPYRADVEHVISLILKHPATQYVIYNRRIASRSWGFTWRPYNGSNPHDKHFHVSTREEQEGSDRPWGIAPIRPPGGETVSDLSQASVDKVWAKKTPSGSTEILPDGTEMVGNQIEAGTRLAYVDKRVFGILGLLKSLWRKGVVHEESLTAIAHHVDDLNARIERIPHWTPDEFVTALVTNPVAMDALAQAIAVRIPQIPTPEQYAQALLKEIAGLYKFAHPDA